MINKKYRKALSEVYLILLNMNEGDFNKIPKDLITFIKDNKDNNYNPQINDLPIKDLNLLPETKGLLGFLYAKYWAKDEDDRAQFIALMKDNEYKARKT